MGRIFSCLPCMCFMCFCVLQFVRKTYTTKLKYRKVNLLYEWYYGTSIAMGKHYVCCKASGCLFFPKGLPKILRVINKDDRCLFYLLCSVYFICVQKYSYHGFHYFNFHAVISLLCSMFQHY